MSKCEHWEGVRGSRVNRSIIARRETEKSSARGIAVWEEALFLEGNRLAKPCALLNTMSDKERKSLDFLPRPYTPLLSPQGKRGNPRANVQVSCKKSGKGGSIGVWS